MVTKDAVAKGLDQQLTPAKRAFLYMPLMHSEDLADQDESVRLFEAAGLTDNLKFARHHRELIRQFGRFPHRNAILGRTSSDAEKSLSRFAGCFYRLMPSESPGLVIFAHSDTRTLDGFYGKVWLSSKTKYGRYYGLESGLKNVTFIPVWLLMVWVFGAFALSTASAETEPELKGEALHIALVETALKYDFFNQRCRGVSASQNEAKVWKVV